MFKPAFALAIAYFIRHIVLKLSDPDVNAYELMLATHNLTMAIIWGLLKWKWPVQSTKLVFVYALS